MDQTTPPKKGPPSWIWIFVVIVAVTGALGRPYAQAWIRSIPGGAKYVPFLLACAACIFFVALFKILNRPKPHA
jgi:hypothetical protein